MVPAGERQWRTEKGWATAAAAMANRRAWAAPGWRRGTGPAGGTGRCPIALLGTLTRDERAGRHRQQRRRDRRRGPGKAQPACAVFWHGWSRRALFHAWEPPRPRERRCWRVAPLVCLPRPCSTSPWLGASQAMQLVGGMWRARAAHSYPPAQARSFPAPPAALARTFRHPSPCPAQLYHASAKTWDGLGRLAGAAICATVQAAAGLGAGAAVPRPGALLARDTSRRRRRQLLLDVRWLPSCCSKPHLLVTLRATAG